MGVASVSGGGASSGRGGPIGWHLAQWAEPPPDEGVASSKFRRSVPEWAWPRPDRAWHLLGGALAGRGVASTEWAWPHRVGRACWVAPWLSGGPGPEGRGFQWAWPPWDGCSLGRVGVPLAPGWSLSQSQASPGGRGLSGAWSAFGFLALLSSDQLSARQKAAAAQARAPGRGAPG